MIPNSDDNFEATLIAHSDHLQQWHAFTVFPDPTKKDHTMVCIGASGDWTKEMYNKIKSPCHRTLFVLGPFASEFSDMALHTINALAIASGKFK